MFAFLKDNNLLWETGLAGHTAYGKYGKPLKDNIENKVKDEFRRIDFFEIETPLIYKNKVWKDSGHLDRFTDPVISTKKGDIHRLDKLLEEHFPYINYSELGLDEIRLFVDEINEKIEKENDKFFLGEKIENRNLMMSLKSGSLNCCLRPETATATFASFINIFHSNNQTYPINVYQVGKAFRNEISPKNHILRAREFTQAEFQVILPLDKKNDKSMIRFTFDEDYILNIIKDNEIGPVKAGNLIKGSYVYVAYIWFLYDLFVKLGIDKQNMRLRQHQKDELIFYATDAWDIEVKTKEHGWIEVAGVHDRGTYDLRNQKIKEIPNIIEIAIGIDRLFYSIIETNYDPGNKEEGRKAILKIPYELAPVQYSVCPVIDKPELTKLDRVILDFVENVIDLNEWVGNNQGF